AGLARECRVALAARFPFVRVEAGERDIGVRAAVVAERLQAGVVAERGAASGVSASHLLEKELTCRIWISRRVLHDAAEVICARRAEAARALRDLGCRDVRRIHRPTDAKTIEVAIRHVTERDTVHRLPDLLRLKAAHGDAVRPLVHRETVGALHVHAW